MDYNYIESLIKNIPISIAVTNREGIIKSVNSHMLSSFGYQKSEIENTCISNLFEGFESLRYELSSKDIASRRKVYVDSKTNKLKMLVSAYFASYKDDNYDIVFIFEDIKKEGRKLANKIAKNRAIYTFDKIIYKSDSLLRVINFAKKISDSKSTVLISGETGTGKEIFAQSIHNESNRKNEAFIAINSAAIPANLIESELFGYVGGAFTGAEKSGKMGKFELADKGTIFLDEIGEMPLNLQTGLLRVVEEGIVTRVGGIEQIVVDIRIIAASNKDLKKEVAQGRFREDLFYRLNVLPLKIPPLRKRKEDILTLSEFFMEKTSKRLNKNKVKLSNYIINKMISYDWPGNVRELENLIEFIINLEYIPDDIFDEENIKVDKSMDMVKVDTVESYSLEELEKQHIIKMLKLYEGNISKTAKVLEIGRNTLYNKINKYNI